MKNARRPYGSGTVERFRNRFRARLPGRKRPVLDTYDTEEEAHRMLDAFHVAAEQEGAAWTGAETVRTYGARFLDRREAEQLASSKTDRSRWKHHVDGAPFIDWPLENVERRHVRDWVTSLAKKSAADRKKRRLVSFQTRKHAFNLIRALFTSAVEDGLVKSNPCTGMKLRDPGATEEGWTYLTLDEQRALARAELGEADRIRTLFAVYTGLRQGEQWNLELRDLRHEDAQPHVVVRKGSRDRATKSRKIQRVPLVPAAVDLVKTWLRMLPRYAEKNPLGLVFPTPRGCRRQRGKLYGFKAQLRKAGIKRPVRWHDLRHTSGSSLVAGWWGRAWSLIEVRDFLRHSSVTQTERYAHLAPTVVSSAAAATNGHHIAITPEAPIAKAAKKLGRARQESNLRPTAPEFYDLSSDLAALGAIDGNLVAKSERYLRAVTSRNRHAKRYATELGSAVLALHVVALARAAVGDGGFSFAAATRLASTILEATAKAAPRRSA